MSDFPARLSADAPTLHVDGSAAPADEVRFTPGSIVAERYRIIALLGRGGMGEVYRAEDLRLNQSVALKYLPQSLASRPGALDRLYAEVRLGRQISHPNVCRLYDLVEVSGHHFIAMEYVDGEDLASLLRRVGKLPAAKVVQIARDLFAGLAAVHEHGVVHRDIKPANVMLDSRGRARLTDFGLAAISEETGARKEIAGTPAYMSPEQISGDRVTPRSDLYSLALVLYELFTGRRLFEASTFADIVTKHNQPKPRLAPAVPDLDPDVERVVLRCLAEDPAERPASAREVLAAFPETDPLAALIRAGETPSPALIAAAGEEGTISERTGVLLAVAALAGLLLLAYVTPRAWLWGRVETKSLDALADRAGNVIRDAGYDPKTLQKRVFWHRMPSSLLFVERFSPRPMVAVASRRRVTLFDPPADGTIGQVVLDAEGNLLLFDAPAEVAPGRAPSMQKLIDATAVDPAAVRVVTTGNRIVSLETTPSIRPALKRRLGPTTSGLFTSIFQMIVAVLSTIFAFRNLRAGRVDRRGGARIALVAFVFGAGMSMMNAQHTRDAVTEWAILIDVLGTALFFTAQISFLYLAIEPFLRRKMPHALISWSRLLAGRWQDPLVGRDVLVGLVAGLFAACLEFGPYALFGLKPIAWTSRHLDPIDVAFAQTFNGGLMALYFGLGITSIFVGIRAALPEKLAPFVFAVVVLFARWPTDPKLPAFVGLVILIAIVVFVIMRFGLLSFTAFALMAQLPVRLPLTLDYSQWYGARAMFTMGLIAALVLYGWRVATKPSAQWMYGPSDSATALRD